MGVVAAPSMAASVLIVVAFTWNEFLFALTIGLREAKVISVHMSGAVDSRGIQFWFMSEAKKRNPGNAMILSRVVCCPSR